MLKYTSLQVCCVSSPRVVGSNPVNRAFHVLKPQLRDHNVEVSIVTSPLCLETQGRGFRSAIRAFHVLIPQVWIHNVEVSTVTCPLCLETQD